MAGKGYSLLCDDQAFLSINTYTRQDGSNIFCLNGFGESPDDVRHLYMWAELDAAGLKVGGARLKNGVEHFGPGIEIASGSTQDIGGAVVEWTESLGVYRALLKQDIDDSFYIGSAYPLKDDINHIPVAVIEQPIQRAEIRFSMYDQRSYQIPADPKYTALGFGSTSDEGFGIYARVDQLELR